MRILHTGDIHFCGDLLGEIIKCAGFLLNKAREISPDAIVIAGDLFDEHQPYDVPTFVKAVEFVRGLAETAPMLIVKGTPSHDGRTLEFLRSDRVYVAEIPEQVILTSDGVFEEFPCDETIPEDTRCVFSCLPSVSKAGVVSALGGDLNGSNRDTVELMRDILVGWKEANNAARALNVPAVLVGHLSVTGATLSTGQQMVGREIELGVEDLRMSGAELVCLGHIHKAQNWSEIYYCGSLTRLNFGEEEKKGFWVHTIENGTLVSSEFVETPARVMVTIDLDDPPAGAKDPVLPEVPDGAFVKVRYEVSEEEVHAVDEEALRKALESSGAASVKVEKTVKPRERVRAEGISKVSALDEKLRRWAETTGADISAGVFEKLRAIEKEEEDIRDEDEVFESTG